MRIQVKDFMIAPVVMCLGERTVKEARDLMNYHGIHSIPVIEYTKQLPENKVNIRGIVTISDLHTDLDTTTKVEDIMTTQVHVVHQESSAQAAAKMMMKHSVHHIVVMEDGEIIGILSALDFVRLVAEHTLD